MLFFRGDSTVHRPYVALETYYFRSGTTLIRGSGLWNVGTYISILYSRQEVNILNDIGMRSLLFLWLLFFIVVNINVIIMIFIPIIISMSGAGWRAGVVQWSGSCGRHRLGLRLTHHPRPGVWLRTCLSLPGGRLVPRATGLGGVTDLWVTGLGWLACGRNRKGRKGMRSSKERDNRMGWKIRERRK